MIVCIAEKPSVARDIANILGATVRRTDKGIGHYEGNGYAVTWTFGHLCTLKEPHDYTPGWKAWSLASLPMIPERFGIKAIPIEHYERQLAVIGQRPLHVPGGYVLDARRSYQSCGAADTGHSTLR